MTYSNICIPISTSLFLEVYLFSLSIPVKFQVDVRCMFNICSLPCQLIVSPLPQSARVRRNSLRGGQRYQQGGNQPYGKRHQTCYVNMFQKLNILTSRTQMSQAQLVYLVSVLMLGRYCHETTKLMHVLLVATVLIIISI